jgi:RNA 2',3'-cyclic 3'-phosphodiesterase
MRLFFAAMLESRAASVVAELQRSLRQRHTDPGVRWVSLEQLHYTLKFLGEVDASTLGACSQAAREAIQLASPFQLDLEGIGAFPSAKAPKVIWLGASAGSRILETLAARLDQQLSKAGFEQERRPFRPHLTLARIKGLSAERAAARMLQAECVQAVASTWIASLVLMQSHLAPRGATYTVVESFAF